MELNDALAQFDAAETTLRRLEATWARLAAAVPEGIQFVGSSPTGIAYEDDLRAFASLADGLPEVDGYRIGAFPLALDEIAQGRLDAHEVGEIEMVISVEQAVSAPGEAVREYRWRFNRMRRRLVRGRLQQLLAEIEGHLASLCGRIEPTRDEIVDPEWQLLTTAVREVDRLTGSTTPRRGRWSDLSRHVAWGMGVDLHDIANVDWPSVLPDIQAGLFSETEPLPVEVGDLSELVEAKPTGAASVKLRWDSLDDEGFERVIFNIISDSEGYENPRWLTRTRAPDRGRDLSVDRVLNDSLSGVRRLRVILQCKHWLTKSVGPRHVADALATMPLLEPPPVDVLIIVTSGRFTGDGVTFIDAHNEQRKRPLVEPWPESHLESLLARRPHVVPPGLRSGD